MAAPLHITLLGGFGLTRGGRPVTTVDTTRLQSLLAYLVLRRGKAQPRQNLAFTFWPDSKEKQALTNLRNLLHHLRRALPDADRFLQVNAKTLTWRSDGPFVLDVADFERALDQANEALQRTDETAAQAALECAVTSYGGALLPGCYDDWVFAERERLRQEGVRALERLVQLLEDGREYAAALHHAQHLLQHDPLREPTYRLLMHLHALDGDRAGALRVYQSCVTALKRELDMEPEPATHDLYERLLNGQEAVPQEPQEPAVSSAELPLVGRRHEWKQLRPAWHAAAEGSAHVVAITGEAGIGKTRLAEELLAWTGRQGIFAARTQSYAAEGRLAYAPVTEWLRADILRAGLSCLEEVWLVEVSRLLPELRTEHPELPSPEPLAGHGQRQRLFEALARAVLAGGRPLLLFLDDLQWCDPDTMAWLRFLLRFAPEARLLLVVTVRAEEVDPAHPLRELFLELGREGQMTEVTLDPLDAADTARLAAHAAGRELDEDQTSRLYRETEGNPLFVVESVRAGLPPAEAPVPGDASAALFPSVPSLPPTVQAVITKRLVQLSPAARALAGLAATIGRAFTFEVLARASYLDEEPLMRALDELWQRRIVRERDETTYDFTHDKLREGAYAEVSPPRRRLLHQRVAEALEAHHVEAPDAVSARVAAHYDRAGLTERAIAAYQRAAQVAQAVYANQDVESLLSRALALLGRLPESRARDERELTLQTLLGPSLVALKGYSAHEARQHYERARALNRRLGQPGQSPVLRALASAYVIGGELKRGHEAGKELLELGRQRAEELVIVEGHYVLGISSFWLGRFVPSREHLEQALAHYDPQRRGVHLALYAQDPGVVCLSRLAWTLWYLGFPDQAIAKSRECLALVREIDHPFSRAYVLQFLTFVFIDLREVEEAAPFIERLIALSREECFPLFELMGSIFEGWLQVERGAVETGIAQIHRGLEAMPKHEVYLVQSYCFGLLAQGFLTAGRPTQGLHAVSQAFAFIERYEERFFEAELHRIRGALLLAQGANEQEAEAQFQRAIAVARRQRAKSLELRAQLDLSRLRHRRGRTDDARQSLQEVFSGFTEGFDTPDLKEAAALLRAWA